MEKEKRPPDTLKALFEASFVRFRERPAFTSMGVTLDYGELERLSAAFGAFLRRGLGLEPGERVAVMLPNLLQYPVALAGALRAGLTVVNVNPLYTPSELQFQLADSGAAAIVVLENFACKATAALALRHLLARPGAVAAADVRYVINCGEEAVGDRYQRGGGNLAKAVAEWAGCARATGSDVKAFCCGPMHALMLAGALVRSGLYDDVVVLAGGSLAKLGMKFQGHLKHGMPIVEDVLAGFAAHVGRDEGRSPVLRLDAIGRHEVASGSSPLAVVKALYSEPLARAGLTLLDVDRFSLELHNPEATEPAGSGNVPLTNYRTLASLAVVEKLIDREGIDAFVRARGMPGFSPTQGHIASAIPYLGHALRGLTGGTLARTMFTGKGSLFLGRMTQLSDGISLVLERNPGRAATA